MDGPQCQVPLGTSTTTQPGGVSGWQGMTIKDILEKVDLFNITSLINDDNQKLKDTKSSLIIPDGKDEKSQAPSQQTNSAFLGPKIWKKPLNLYKLAGGENEGSGTDMSRNAPGAQFSLMNMDDFLAENNFDIGRISPPIEADMLDRGGVRQSTPYSTETEGGSQFSLDDVEIDSEPPIGSPQDSEMPNSPSSEFEMNCNVGKFPQPSAYESNPKKDAKQGGNEFLYAESKRAKLEREKEERRRREDTFVEFSAEELALATIPGADFDPTRRRFSTEELRPQPIIRKRQKLYVDFEKKDDKYWEKRGKNNIAARRSREARRLKENQIALRTSYLEKQNAGLRAALRDANIKNENLELEKNILKQQLEKFESMAEFFK